MFHITIFRSNYWNPYWAYVYARLANYMVCTIDEKLGSQKTGLSINEGKTKYVKISRMELNLASEINLDGQRFEIVNHFKYFGSLLTSKNEISEEIRGRIIAGNRCYYSLKRIFK